MLDAAAPGLIHGTTMSIRDDSPAGLLSVFVTSCALLLAIANSACPQQESSPFPFPFPTNAADADAFFEKMFGGTPEDQQALEAIEVSPEDERRLGERMVEAYRAEARRRRIAITDRGREAAYLGKLVRGLQRSMTNAERYQSIRVLVLDTPILEARSFPGGTLTFSRGLIEFAGSEAALVGIVGHELSHLDHGHQLLPIRRLKLLQNLPTGGGQAFDPQAFMSNGATLMRLARPFRPEDEEAADRDAVTWAFEAGYDPRELAELFLRMDRQQNQPGFPVPAMFRSHPVSENRHREAMRLFDELIGKHPEADLAIGAENLKRRVPRSEQAFGE
jgi:predicted Zn-dependent protease